MKSEIAKTVQNLVSEYGTNDMVIQTNNRVKHTEKAPPDLHQ